MARRKPLRLVQVSYVTKDGTELTREQLTDEQYQVFCDDMAASRIRHGIVWPSLDEERRKANEG